MSRLLILSCSQRKNQSSTPLPAFSRYDGVCFKVLHKLERTARLPDDLRIFMLSAEYGLLSAGQEIDYYDRVMTPARARELCSAVGIALDAELRATSFTEGFVNLGRLYLPALAASSMLKQLPITYAAGGIGQKMAQMKEWIVGTRTGPVRLKLDGEKKAITSSE